MQSRPGINGNNYGLKFMSSAGQLVTGAWWHGAVNGFADNALRLEHLEALREGTWVAIAHVPANFVETFAAVQQSAHNVQNPFLLQERNGFYGWTEWLYLVHSLYFSTAWYSSLQRRLLYYIYYFLFGITQHRRNTHEPNLEY
jgi:hypothetical protein